MGATTTTQKTAGPVRCERCHARIRPPVSAASVRLAEAAGYAGEIAAPQAAVALASSADWGRRALALAVREGLLERARVSGRRGGVAYRYRPTAAAAAYVLSDGLARRLQALARLGPASRSA
jgi:hypothetical protein